MGDPVSAETLEIDKEDVNSKAEGDSCNKSAPQEHSQSDSNALTDAITAQDTGSGIITSDGNISAPRNILPEETARDKSRTVAVVTNSSVCGEEKGAVDLEVGSVAKSEHVAPVTCKNSDPCTTESGHGTPVTCNNSETSVSAANYEFDGECYCYTDKESGITYKFDNGKQEWVIKGTLLKKDTFSAAGDDGSDDEDDDIDEDGNKKHSRFVKQDMTAGVYSFEGDTHIYTDPTDGTKYMWDKEKNAWFPKIDEDFLAHYQMNYGFLGDNTKNSEPEDSKKVETAVDKEELKRKAPSQPTWFEIDEVHNTKVYVNHLPEDVTEQEFIDIMQKCGLIMKDPDTGKLKIKLYTVAGSNQLKGDGLCTYIRIESVDLALKVLDGYELRGHKLSVERAKFQMKGDYNPTLKPKKRRKKDKEKLKKIQEKLLDWRPDMLRGERPKHEKVVVLKNLFEPSLFENNVQLILEYQQDLREECTKFGVVRKVVIHDRHQEGVAQVFFSDPEEADICVKFLNGRWYSQRQLKAETWDGKTKYRIVETEEQTKERLAKWNNFLEKGEQKQ